jgi:hypothetical protein
MTPVFAKFASTFTLFARNRRAYDPPDFFSQNYLPYNNDNITEYKFNNGNV